ncbi:MAG TPA: hypothetical protein VJP83_15850, partial [Terriglobales bacterium]|nr:hypothetical protein [Terriglobales bacterium]
MRQLPFSFKTFAALLLLTLGAVVVAGYHPAVEDAEIYLPGVLKVLNPQLFPYNQGFFASHAHLTLYPNLIAASVRISHLPFEYAMLLWQLLAVWLLLFACWRISRLRFPSPRAIWGAVALSAALLTIPVAGTSLYIMDQNVNTRTLSTPMILLAIVNVVEHKWARGLVWIVLTGLIHPLMVVFGAAYMFFVIWMERRELAPVAALALLPLGFFPPVTEAYRQILNTREYFFLLRWEWYEWLGLLGPLPILWCYGRIAGSHHLPVLKRLCSALIIFELVFFAAALVLTIPPQFANLAELQPMRALLLVYIFMFLFTGGLLAQWVLGDKAWRWVALFLPLCLGMWYAQRQLFPASPHLELPWTSNNNQWVQTFDWIRQNTPVNAYFALNPQHMELPGEDQHGFRAIAERSMLADALKDSGAASMFPQLAPEWQRQTQAEKGWNNFHLNDLQTLKAHFGVDWVVLEHPVAGLECPY